MCLQFCSKIHLKCECTNCKKFFKKKKQFKFKKPKTKGQIKVGDGLFNHMTAHLPSCSTSGKRSIWCPKLGFPELGSTLDEKDANKDFYNSKQVEVIAKKPEWSEEVQSLVLDFRDRQVLASSKNFQLVYGKRPASVLCQFGKISKDIFILDMRFPLSFAQGFGIALSTMFWR